MTPLTLTQPFHTSFWIEARCNRCEVQIGERLAMRALTPDAPAPPVNTRQGGVHIGTAAPTGASELAFSHSRLPATLPTHAYPTFFNSHHPPRLPPARFGTRTALHRVPPHALDGASLGSISAPPQHAHLSGLRPRSPESAPPNAASAARTHTRAVTAGWMTRTLSQSSPGPGAVVSSVVPGRNACIQCCLESFCASRLSALRARLCMCALSDVGIGIGRNSPQR